LSHQNRKRGEGLTRVISGSSYGKKASLSLATAQRNVPTLAMAVRSPKAFSLANSRIALFTDDCTAGDALIAQCAYTTYC